MENSLVNIELRKETELGGIKSELIRREYDLKFFDEFNIGNVYICHKYSDRWSVIKITGFDEAQIHYLENDTTKNFDEDAEEEKYSHKSFVEYYAHRYQKFNSIEEAHKYLYSQTPEEILKEAKELNQSVNGGSDMGLVDLSNGSFYKAQLNGLAITKEETDKLIFKHRFHMDTIKNSLQQQAWALDALVKNLTTKLKTFQELLDTLEAYQYAKDNIFQFNSGKNSPRKTINLYKKILFMDEEVGLPNDASIDAFNIEKFFEYLKVHYKMLLDEKSVTMFRIRRKADKKYSSNPYVNASMNQDNLNTFLVFRNGDNLHAIDTGEFYDDLYPSENFMLDINKKVQDIHESSRYNDMDKENEIENIKQKVIFEHKKLLIVESILVNTTVFEDTTSDGKRVSLLNELSVPEENLKYVDYIDLVLNSENRPLFKDYLKNVNNNLKHGSRIYLVHTQKDKYTQRFSEKFEDRYNYNEWSSMDVRFEDFYKFYTDGVLPPRVIGYIKVKVEWLKVKLKYYIYEYDSFINYDDVTIDDINYYLVDRYVRRNYMSYMTYLLGIEKKLREEKAEEEQLIQLMINNLRDVRPLTREEVIEKVEWWKNKTKEFRFLLSDNEKAWRMITKELLKPKE